MVSIIKWIFSLSTNRYVDKKYDLDLTYITDNIVAMG